MESQTFEISYFDLQVGDAIKIKKVSFHSDRSQLPVFAYDPDFLKGCASNFGRSDSTGSDRASHTSFFMTARHRLSALGKLIEIAVGIFLIALALSSLDATLGRLPGIALQALFVAVTFPFAATALRQYVKSLNLDIEVDFLAAVLQVIYGILIVGLNI